MSLEDQNRYRERYRTRKPGWEPATEQFATLIEASLSPTSRVLDLGCGRGGLVEQLTNPTPNIVGVDPDIISLIEHRLPDLPRAAAFSHALPFRSQTFDLIYATWLMEHLDLPVDTLREVARVLRPGGRFIFITPNARHPLSAFNRWLGRLGRWQQKIVNRAYGRAESDTFPTRYRANTPAVLDELAIEGGLRLDELLMVADPSYLAFSPTLFRVMCWLEEMLPPDRHIHLVGIMEKPAEAKHNPLDGGKG